MLEASHCVIRDGGRGGQISGILFLVKQDGGGSRRFTSSESLRPLPLLKPYANTLKAVVFTALAEGALFAGAIYFELNARGLPMRRATETGFIVIGYAALLFGILCQWQADRRAHRVVTGHNVPGRVDEEAQTPPGVP